LGEDPELFGDTLDEVILDCPNGHNLEFKIEAIQELRKLLSFTDEQIDRIIQTNILLAIDPTADVKDEPNWGRYPDYRTFWEAVLRTFENDPEVREHGGDPPRFAP